MVHLFGTVAQKIETNSSVMTFVRIVSAFIKARDQHADHWEL